MKDETPTLTATNHPPHSTPTWETYLSEEKSKPYFQHILAYVKQRRLSGATVYPKQSDIFNALKYTPLDQVKVVIIGQDPYHRPRQAHGLSFSVPKGILPPPSLNNIFQELHHDLGIPTPPHGCLQQWAEQGVLLLNAVLTVEEGQPQSHAGRGWEQFTDKVIQVINDHTTGVVFLLWGSYAQKKGAILDPFKHAILQSTHPSPLSAHRGFLGCRHFSKTNTLLEKAQKQPIQWALC